MQYILVLPQTLYNLPCSFQILFYNDTFIMFLTISLIYITCVRNIDFFDS